MDNIAPEEIIQTDIDRVLASLREKNLRNKLKIIKYEKIVETVDMLRAIIDSIDYTKSSIKEGVTFLEDIDPDSLKFVINEVITILEDVKEHE